MYLGVQTMGIPKISSVSFGIYIYIFLESLYRNELNFDIEKSYYFHLIILYIYRYFQSQPTHTLRTILLRGK
jgi:hypothetical protein